jgi:hypothetical protein
MQWGSPAAYLRNVWGWLDVAVVADGILGLAWLRGNGTWSSCIRVMRVMRICHRIPQLEVGAVLNWGTAMPTSFLFDGGWLARNVFHVYCVLHWIRLMVCRVVLVEWWRLLSQGSLAPLKELRCGVINTGAARNADVFLRHATFFAVSLMVTFFWRCSYNNCCSSTC